MFIFFRIILYNLIKKLQKILMFTLYIDPFNGQVDWIILAGDKEVNLITPVSNSAIQMKSLDKRTFFQFLSNPLNFGENLIRDFVFFFLNMCS